MHSIGQLRENFKDPPIEYRSAPFWSWNAELRPDELARQVADMGAHGMGGFFMHSREGLETPYLGEEFMGCVKATVTAARENGMKAWIYDEDRYSSGMGGGLVPKTGGDAVRAKALALEIYDEIPEYAESIVALFEARINGNGISDPKRVDPMIPCSGRACGGEAAAPGGSNASPDANEAAGDGNKAASRDGCRKWLLFRREISKASEWCQNDTYVDMLNPETIKVFLKTTHEKYKQCVGDEFGKTVAGLFTDEPTVSGFAPREREMRWIPWSDVFAPYFLEKRGYDILDRVPYMFFEGEAGFKTRHDFWRTVTELFCEVYSKGIGDWCRDNGLKFTGHFHSEQNMAAAARTSGAVMPHYRYYDVPGVDTLCEQTSESITIKQCSSVANQYGKKRVLSETFGVTGWGFTFEGMKWLIDWQYALGVNFLCQHLAHYTLKGCRKRDYPPSFNYNNCWWEHYPIVERYAARLGMALSQGKPVRDLLIIHPSSTVWGMLGAGERPEADACSMEFGAFVDRMLAEHYDFDLGDETILMESGKAWEGKLYVNMAGYKVVVLPPVKTLFASTIRLLREFLQAGGDVVLTGEIPAMVEGDASDAFKELCGLPGFHAADEIDGAVKALESVLPRKVSIKDGAGREDGAFLYMLRELGDGYSLFVVNNDRENGHEARLDIPILGTAEEWDLLAGDIRETAAAGTETGICVEERFMPAASKLYMIRTGGVGGNIGHGAQGGSPREACTTSETCATSTTCATNMTSATPATCAAPKTGATRAVSAARTEVILDRISGISRTMPNALTLDRCSYRIEDSAWSEEMGVWMAQREIRDALGMKQVYQNGILQRHHWIYDPHPKDGTRVELRLKVAIAELPESVVHLGLEEAEHYTVAVNGVPVDGAIDGWYLDKSIKKLRLSNLKTGSNEITLSAAYTNRMEMEDCYVIGDFGVDAKRRITGESAAIEYGDWCLQGYPHYCGSLVYRFEYSRRKREGESVILELGDYSAVTAEIRVNGKTAGHIPWRAANGIEISGLLLDGGNAIEIEITGSPVNLLGPLHRKPDGRNWTDCRSFRTEGDKYSPEYILKPYGLMEPAHLTIQS